MANKNASRPLYTRKRYKTVVLLLLLSALIISIFSISLGATFIPIDVIFKTLLRLGGETQEFIIYKYRLPRVVLAWCVGFSLGVAGVIIQHTLNNNLASPQIIGINSGAALCTLVVTFALPQIPVSSIPLVASLGGILAGFITYIMSWSGGIYVMRFAMVGIAFAYTLDSASRFILSHGGHELSAALVWFAGSFWGRTWAHVYAFLPVLALLLPVVYLLSYRLEILRLGDTSSKGLGIAVERVRLILLLSATVLASTSVGVAGILGFVALITPHIATILVGNISRRTEIVAGLLSVDLILLADLAGRIIMPPIEVPAGVIVALFGSPYFIYLLSKYKGNKYA